MKIFTLFVSFLFVGFYMTSEPKCKDFKNGSFIFYQKAVEDFDDNFITIRDGNEQLYIDKNSRDTMCYDVKWLNDCDFRLILSETTRTQGVVQLGDTLFMSIEPIDEEVFSFESSFNKNGQVYNSTGKMKKFDLDSKANKPKK